MTGIRRAVDGPGNNPLLAHRAAWELTHAPIAEGLFVGCGAATASAATMRTFTCP